MVRQSAQQSLIGYLTETKSHIQTLLNVARTRHKTLKTKASISTLQVFLMRIEGALLTAKTGSGEDLYIGAVDIQKGIYDPIIEFWAKELQK